MSFFEFLLTNDIIAYNIFEYLTAIDSSETIYNITIISSLLYDKWKKLFIKPMKENLNDTLLHLGYHQKTIEKVLFFMRLPGAVISGSLAVKLMFNMSFEPGDIDIFVPEDYMNQLDMDWGFDTIGSYGGGWICFKDRKNGVDIIFGDVRQMISEFDVDSCKCYITSDHVIKSLYPATLFTRLRKVHDCAFPRLDRAKKYLQRGFKLYYDISPFYIGNRVIFGKKNYIFHKNDNRDMIRSLLMKIFFSDPIQPKETPIIDTHLLEYGTSSMIEEALRILCEGTHPIDISAPIGELQAFCESKIEAFRLLHPGWYDTTPQ
eukprot:TRINITY_DN3422_c0_g2_i1.p1 TRINITY_DN3422_c0_g2~~TRINITY_DN3422_c0_g2_i1.p1  ORF type:complete len:319 (-),score=36.49 TRINITY_DN3422_c0_g2_i1:63-1019(-)